MSLLRVPSDSGPESGVGRFTSDWHGLRTFRRRLNGSNTSLGMGTEETVG